MTKRELLGSLNAVRSLMRDRFAGSRTASLSVSGKVMCSADLSEDDLTQLIDALVKDIREEQISIGLTMIDCTAVDCRGSFCA